MALRAARENNKHVSLWRAIAARAVLVAPSMQPSEMSTIAFSFARVRFRDRTMLMHLAEATPPILAQFKAIDITYFLAAFARLEVNHKLVFNIFAREIARKLHDFSAAQLGELVYAYARLHMRHELLLPVLQKRIATVVKALEPLHLAMIVNGFARLSVADEGLFTILASEICNKIHRFSGQPLALVANAFARMVVRNRFLLEVLSNECIRQRGELEPQSVALLLNAHARLSYANPVLFDYFAGYIPRKLKDYNMQSVCLVASAYGRLQQSEPHLFEKLGDFACTHARLLTPRGLSTLLFSFAQAEIRHGVLFYHAPQHVSKHLAVYTTDELAMVAHAYGHFQMVHLPLFDTISLALRDRVLNSRKAQDPLVDGAPEFQDEEQTEPGERVPRVGALVALMEAYARLTIYQVDILERLCNAVTDRHEELEPSMVVQAVQAVATLSYVHNGLLGMAAKFVQSHGQDLPTDELEILQSHLAMLDVNNPDSGLFLERTLTLPAPLIAR